MIMFNQAKAIDIFFDINISRQSKSVTLTSDAIFRIQGYS